MKSSLFLFLSLILLCSCVEEEEFPLENDIMVLTNATFNKAIEKYEHILVMFYAPWCGHCKKFKPELEKAAATLRKENLMVAKVDATVEKDLASKYKVRGYPTVKFFKKGVPMDYTAGRTEKDVINWMRKKSGPPARKLSTSSEVEDLQKSNDVCIVYFGKNEDDLKAFNNVAEKNDDLPFAIVEDAEVAKKFNAKQRSVVLFKKFDEKRNDLETVKEKELTDFIAKSSMKKVGSFDGKTAELVFEKNKRAIVDFGTEGDKWNAAESLMKKMAEKLGAQ
jgi:protein disulfide-isomerase A1